MNRIGRAIEMVVLQSRWLVAPFLLGLIVGLGALLYKFVFKLFDFVTQVRPAPEEEVIVGVLKLVDLSYYNLAQFAGGAHAQSHVYLPTNRPRGRCRSDNRSAKPLVGSRGDDVFQLSTLRNDPSVSHKKRLPGRATLLALHQSLSQPPRAFGASMTGSARCWGRADRRGSNELRVRYFCFRRPRSRGRESTRARPTACLWPSPSIRQPKRGALGRGLGPQSGASFLSRGLGESDSFDTISPALWPRTPPTSQRRTGCAEVLT